MQWRVLDVKADKLLEPTAQWSAPTEVPVVGSAEDLKLEKSASPKFIWDALVWLAQYKGLVYFLITLDNAGVPAALVAGAEGQEHLLPQTRRCGETS